MQSDPSTSDDLESSVGEEKDITKSMRLRDFLASIPSFSDFTDQQFVTLEQKAQMKDFPANEVIFKQGEKGDAFFVIHKGAVDILIQDNAQLLKKGDLGRAVNRLKEGAFFGERALMTAELRAASIKTISDTTCLVFTKAVFEDVICGSSALIGKDADDNVDWSKDHETRSLFKHIEAVLEIDCKDNTSPQIKRVLYELSTAFTPELSPDEVISRMVMTVKSALKADRVGLFVLSEDRRSMVLKISERSKGVRLPVRGLAGAVIQANEAMNIPDAYLDPRFDATMDRRTGYRTRQVLGVPLRHPVTGRHLPHFDSLLI
jgi:CRP-like cAMP-binding protein